MKELYIEGVAIHGGPESCVGVREGVGEALTTCRLGHRAAKSRFRGADAVNGRGRQHRRQRYARAAGGPRAVEEPGHVRNLHAREPGGPTVTRPR